MATQLPGFRNGALIDPRAYIRSLIGAAQARDWQATLANIDPDLAKYGVMRQSGTSKYTFNGQTIDVLGSGGSTWAWEADPRTGGAMGTAANRAAQALWNQSVTPDPYQDPVDPLSKYREAIDAATRARRKAAGGGRASTIAAGFSAGAPTTRRATLGGSY